MQRQIRALVIGMALTTLALSPWAIAQQKYDDPEHAALAKAMKEAKVSLQNGLAASAKEGTPVSAKYEVEHDKLQLSDYTMKGDKFGETIVYHNNGKVAKRDPTTEGDDLTAAKVQAEAMAKAKRTLADAVGRAVKANAGYRAISVTPAVSEGHPVAEVVLLKGADWKTVSEMLD